MEMGSEGHLFDLLQKKKKLKEGTISFVCISILDEINHIHERKIIHRDIKP